MKKIIFASAALVSVVGAMDVSATTVCDKGTVTSVAGTAGKFVITSFTPKCSANSNVDGVDNTSYFAVGANSIKGKTSFMGSTAGGGIVPYTTCASAGACTATEASDASAKAPST